MATGHMGTFSRVDPAEIAEAETRRRLDGVLRLVDLTGRLAAEHDLDAVLAAAADLACRAVGCERASLFLHDERTGTLATRVATELEVSEIRVPVGRGVAGWVAEHRTPANVADPSADARWSDAADRATGFTTRNLLAVPLLTPVGDDEASGGTLVGVLQLLNKPGGFDAFDERLAAAFASHAAIAIERASLLDRVRAAEAVRAGLEIARGVQAGFLPKRLPVVPGYELAAWWQPAEEVGGDYYDVLPLPDGRVGLVVGDVSGHGVGPSLLMSEVRAMLRVLTKTESDPSRIMSLLCEAIADDFESGRFVTLLFAALDPVRHRLTWVNAGHGPTLLLDRRAGDCRMLETTAPPLGFCDSRPFPAADPVTLGPGDLLLVATDGTVELRDEAGEMFGRRRLERLLVDHQREPARRVAAAVREALTAFRPHAGPEDDVTLLLVERKVGFH